jgi:hypothetical protein
MSFSGVVDILHAAPSPQYHLLPSSGLPSPGSLFSDTLRAGSWAATIAKRFIYFPYPSRKTGEQVKKPPREAFALPNTVLVRIHLPGLVASFESFLAVL